MKLKICVSDRCFFPKSALMSSKSIVALAKSLGYDRVEFHPTWAVWLAILLKGKLSCQAKDICSFHASWREDRSYNQHGAIKKFFVPFYYLFPPEPLGTKALQRLEKRYRKPIVIHWPKQLGRFKQAILELHGGAERMSRARVEREISKGTIKGVVIDTDKFSGWLEATGERENQSLRRLFPYIKEIHFRFGHKEDLDPRSVGKKTKSARVMKKLVEMGYKGRVVVEMGWPDPGSIEVLQKLGLKKTHQKIISFLKSL